MRLVSFRVQGFRRFQEAATIDLLPPVVAIVGPNEAGKSSLLEAMSLVNSDEPFRSRQFTDGIAPEDGSTEIFSAVFVLDEDDRSALSDIPEANVLRTYRAYKTADGDLRAALDPELKRDGGLRAEVAGDLERLLAPASAVRRRIDEASLSEDGDAEPESEDGDSSDYAMSALRPALEGLLNGLAAPGDTLGKGLRANLRRAASALDDLRLERPQYAATLPSRLRSLAEQHERPHPNDEARERLVTREPPMLLMRDSERQLENEYRFEEHPEAPAPLANLLALTTTDFEEIRELAADPGDPRLATLLHGANQQLRERLTGSWRQMRSLSTCKSATVPSASSLSISTLRSMGASRSGATASVPFSRC